MYRRLMVFGVLALIVTSAVVAEGSSETPEPAKSVATRTVQPATIEFIDGDVLVDGMPATLGDELAIGSVVEVADNSLCEVTFGQNIVRIYAGTSATISIGDETNQLVVDRGAIGAVLHKLQEVGNDGRLSFRTPTAVGGVRGTIFYVRVESPDSTFVCVCNGTVGLDSAGGTNEQVIAATHHSGLRYLRDANGAITSEVPEMAYHTDDEMQSIASRIGVTIDWSQID